MLLAAGIMFLACTAIRSLPAYPTGVGKLHSSIQLFILMTVGAVTYIGASSALGIHFVNQLLPKRLRLSKTS